MDFIIVSTADWDNPFWTNKQHVAATLADMGHRVLYIDSLGLRAPTMTKTDLSRITRRVKKLFAGTKKVRENIWVMSPFSIPLHKYGIIRHLNQKILIYMTRRRLKELRFQEPVLWTYNPMSSYLLGSLGEAASVYHCVDEISAQPGMPSEHIKRSEIDLLEKVDLVFTTAMNLYNKKKKYNEHCYYYPNVADFDHFHRAVSEKFERPQDLPQEGKKVLGFIGAISAYKQDFQLLRYIAEKCPEYNIVLIGKVGEGEPDTDAGILQECKNIHLLGAKAYRELPRYLSFVDVALLPNSINEYTNNMFPMKFFEYLAAGKPVVATKIPAIQEFSEYCYISDSKEEFVDNVERALREDSEVENKKRFTLASEHTYENRTRKMLKIIISLQKGKIRC